MVDVAYDRQAKPDIDYHLDYQFGAWSGLADYVRQWPELEEIDREAFQLEWEGITESRLRELRRWADEDSLTAHQHARFCQLLALVKTLRPILERLITA